MTGGYHEFNVLINLLDKEWGFSSFGFKTRRSYWNISKTKNHSATKAKLKVIAMGLNIFLRYQRELE
jgi:hypothetical protein